MEDKFDSGIVVFGYLHNDRRETASLVSQFGQMELEPLKDNIQYRIESSDYCETHVQSLQKYLRAEYSSIHHEDSIFEGDPLQYSNELVCEILDSLSSHLHDSLIQNDVLELERTLLNDPVLFPSFG